MDGNDISSRHIVEKLVEMGFENSDVMEAVKAVGPSLDNAVEYILNGCRKNIKEASASLKCSTSSEKALGKRTLSSPPLGQMKQSSLWNHFQPASRPKKCRGGDLTVASVSRPEVLPSPVEGNKELVADVEMPLESLPVCCSREVDVGPDWEQKVHNLLRKHFGYSSLKSFQKEALVSWLAHQDCLVLAATGSGKSLCFQIPALLTGKVVVVISPLISLMHDQCLKLSKHGISACFLGSGQPDSSVEQKAMKGMYSIIYVCPETILRLIKPLQKLAESRGIALFAIDEVHCVSKWGHDFRPDYRRLSALRENFSSRHLKFLDFDIPLMALTATATVRVREDIINTLCMSKETNIVLTSFFRPNLRFSVKHSKTSPSSYEKDFRQLIDTYCQRRKFGVKKQSINSQELVQLDDQFDSDQCAASDLNDIEDGDSYEEEDEINSTNEDVSTVSENKMSIEYLENEVDVFQSVDDWDVACGEFCGQDPSREWDANGLIETIIPPNKSNKPKERPRLVQEPSEQGPTIIYVPTRKETLNIAKYLCGIGVKAAAYNASLPKSHLRRVHKDFVENSLEVVVATIAFGMGIDKSNVRCIIHYGWPQSLDAYYQEVGRAGRDGKLADCILYANHSRVPTLLPSPRSEDQTKQAYKMLSDCFRYGMNTSCCRAKTLVQYFGEDFNDECLLCDVCAEGPPAMRDLREEANILMQIIAAQYAQDNFFGASYDDVISYNIGGKKLEKPNLRKFISKIREQSQKFLATDLLWWQGLARIMEAKGYIKEGDDKVRVQIKFPVPTKRGLDFLQCERDQAFCVYPEADMVLSESRQKSYSTFSDWGKGWADPEIRHERLAKMRSNRKPRQPRKPRKRKPRNNTDLRTVRGRIGAKLMKKK